MSAPTWRTSAACVGHMTVVSEATADEVEAILDAAPGYQLRRLTRLDALITICPVCDQRVIEAHDHAVRRSA